MIRGSSYYAIVNGPAWTQAEANAVALGGHLVTINSESEQLFLNDYFISDAAPSVPASSENIANNLVA